jgi:hypothetical protein
MNLDLNNILWSTAGRDWEFRFLLEPKQCDDWVAYHRSIFQPSATNETDINHGSILSGSVLYTSVVFLDPEGRKDSAGRVIPHEVAVIGEHLDRDNLKNLLWEKLSGVYSQLYGLPYEEIRDLQIIIKGKTLEIEQKKQQQLDEQQEAKPNFQIAIVVVLVTIIAIAVIVFVFIPLIQKTKIPVTTTSQLTPMTVTNCQPNQPVITSITNCQEEAQPNIKTSEGKS